MLPHRAETTLSPADAIMAMSPLTGRGCQATVLACAAGYFLAPPLAPLFLAGAAASVILRASAVIRERRDDRDSKGILCIGRDTDTGRDIWLTSNELRQHLLALGESSFGKGEIFFGWAENALAWNSGFLFVDGKGDTQVYGRLASLARYHGRSGDLRCINLMAPAPSSPDEVASSNTYNPFSRATAEEMEGMLFDLADEHDPLRAARLRDMLSGLCGALVALRDNHGIVPDARTIRDRLAFAGYLELADPVEYDIVGESVREKMLRHLRSLPGFDSPRGGRQPQAAVDAHAALAFPVERVLRLMCEDYAHIFLSPTPEVDVRETVALRHALAVILPSLETAPEYGAIGRLVVGDLRNVIAGLTATRLEGTWEEIVDASPNKAPTPFLVVLDDVHRYFCPSLAVVLTHARYVGIGLALGSTDMAALEAGGHGTASRIASSVHSRMYLRQEEPPEPGSQGDPGERLHPALLRSLRAGHFILERAGRRTSGSLGVAVYPDDPRRGYFRLPRNVGVGVLR